MDTLLSFLGIKTVGQVVVSLITGISGAFLTRSFGEWSQLLDVLLGFVIADYNTGFVAAGHEGGLMSRTGLYGIARKVFIFMIVAAAHQIDMDLGNQNILMTATIFFYLANELLSMTENVGRMGVPIPGVIKNAIKVLQSKCGEETGDSNHDDKGN